MRALPEARSCASMLPAGVIDMSLWHKLKKWIESREPRERIVLLAASAAILVAVWLNLVYDPQQLEMQTLLAQEVSLSSQIAQDRARFAELESRIGQDPNAFARERVRELQQLTREVDEELNRLYGRLILPREMSLLLTRILQQETQLRLLSLENLQPEVMLTAEVDAVPLVGVTNPAVVGSRAQGQVQVFKHGLRMRFEGSFLETIKYLQSLERNESSFFWDGLSFSLTEHPGGTITLEIFTLSTQREYIGV